MREIYKQLLLICRYIWCPFIFIMMTYFTISNTDNIFNVLGGILNLVLDVAFFMLFGRAIKMEERENKND